MRRVSFLVLLVNNNKVKEAVGVVTNGVLGVQSSVPLYGPWSKG
jgi:hypothetical protein